jgi:antitoxin (DNA-binding transcriptional repressor) of toxin-antitoxin stability system
VRREIIVVRDGAPAARLVALHEIDAPGLIEKIPA